MPLNLSTIKPAVLKAKEVATQEYVDNTTANALAGSGFVLPADVAAAINNNTTTINGSKITTGTIKAGAIAAGAITADRLGPSTGTSTVWTGGGLVSANFNGNASGSIGAPTQGFRLSSNAAGTSSDPNIYGGYIKGATLEGARLWVSTPAGYANTTFTDSAIVNYTMNPTSNGTVYTPVVTLYSPSYGSGFLSNRIASSSSKVIITTGGGVSSMSYSTTLTIEYSADGGGWTKLDQFSDVQGVDVFYNGVIPYNSSSISFRVKVFYTNRMNSAIGMSAGVTVTLLN